MNNINKIFLVWLAVMAVVALGAISLSITSEPVVIKSDDETSGAREVASETTQSSSTKRDAEVSGVLRPEKADQKPLKETSMKNGHKVAKTSEGLRQKMEEKSEEESSFKVDFIPPPGTNPQVDSVYEAIRTKEYPERLSPMVPAHPFDEASYLANPEEYLSVIEPGRIWQSAQPASDVPVLKKVGSDFIRLPVGGSTILRVLTAPNAPVTFSALDLGQFENGLPAISVKADEKGRASTSFTVPKGMSAEGDVVAASPMASGQALYLVSVIN